MRRIVVACGVVAASVLAACADGEIREDFEGGRGMWRLPNKTWSIADGKGRDGSRCLTLSVPTPCALEWPDTKSFKVEPGDAYKIEAWVDASEFKPKSGGVSVGLGFYDEKGKLVLGAGAKPVLDNEVRKDGWRRYECVTRTLPAEARTASFYIWAADGSTGTVRFDDISAHAVAGQPLADLCCSAYRAEAWEGSVRFAAGYAVNPMRHDAQCLRAEVRYAAHGGTTAVVPASLSNGVASVTLPVSDFAPGTNDVVLALFGTGGVELGTASCRFARLAAQPRRRVYFDKYNRTVVDGRPFFPLGMYWGEINAADLAVYTNGPFNCLMPYKRPDIAKMDMCADVGVKVMFPVSGWWKDLSEASSEVKANIMEKWIYGAVRKFKEHPAVLAWYLADEVKEPYRGLLEERNLGVHEIDGDHPTWIVIDNPTHVRLFVRGYDTIGMDPYPIGNRGNGRTGIGLAADWARSAQNGMYGFRPMWQVPQAFDWGYYRPTETNNPAVRLPTLAEMRSMTWQAIAAGANGIVYYSFFDLLKRDKWPKERVEGGWDNACKVAREVKARESVLLSLPGPDATCASKSVVCRTWRTDSEGTYLLVCNVTQKPLTAKVDVGKESVPVPLEPMGVKWLKL